MTQIKFTQTEIEALKNTFEEFKDIYNLNEWNIDDLNEMVELGAGVIELLDKKVKKQS